MLLESNTGKGNAISNSIKMVWMRIDEPESYSKMEELWYKGASREGAGMLLNSVVLNTFR